jgi:hypothetical protein
VPPFQGFNMANSTKILAEKPVRGMRVGTVQHSTKYEFGKDGLVQRVARKGNTDYQKSDRFGANSPDFESGVTQNVGKPAQSDGLREAISLIRGK